MRALSKLINENEPDLVLFVGEALVGNDGVNQLQMFNQVPATLVDPASEKLCCPPRLCFFFMRAAIAVTVAIESIDIMAISLFGEQRSPYSSSNIIGGMP